MKKTYTILLLCCFSALLHAQQRKHEIGISWIPVDPTLQPNGFQITYFRHLRPWYHLGVNVFQFGNSDFYSYGNGIYGTYSSYYADEYSGIALTNRLTTAERYRLGAYFNVGLAIYKAKLVYEDIFTDPTMTIPSIRRSEDKYLAVGNIFSGGIYVKPHQRLKISAGVNLFLNWIEIDQTSTYIEPFFETGCFDFNVAWQF
jgi:hypothetical protein